MGTKILRYQVRPGDTLRISRDVTLADRIGGSDWLTESGEDIDLDIHDIELVNRPEPPKPAAKVGDRVTSAHAEPPIGAVISIGSSVYQRQPNGWHIASCDIKGRPLQWGVMPGALGAILIHLPGE